MPQHELYIFFSFINLSEYMDEKTYFEKQQMYHIYHIGGIQVPGAGSHFVILFNAKW